MRAHRVTNRCYDLLQHWAESSTRTAAILCHIACGIGMLLCALVQFDQQARKEAPRRHRAAGYLYTAFGVGCIAALRPLRASTARGHGVLATSFVEVASLLWLCATARALLHAKRGQYAQHRRWMLRSIAIALSPLGQRVALFLFLVPVAMFFRLTAAGIYRIPCWAARWEPSSAGSYTCLHMIFDFPLGMLIQRCVPSWLAFGWFHKTKGVHKSPLGSNLHNKA